MVIGSVQISIVEASQRDTVYGCVTIALWCEQSMIDEAVIVARVVAARVGRRIHEMDVDAVGPRVIDTRQVSLLKRFPLSLFVAMMNCRHVARVAGVHFRGGELM